ncbi:hypothetical protein L873DRAFT_1820406 [Choiromyces venosus 120613-1]|uniref:Far11/STRP N-terminal domain-containing protein n=1 Tax=Choiromyces venosus 120613-1 TaxID=1336337 RepID=A0A3N4J0W4_9PEZI|nr:hypothetical protein L873DRAFT_1820406 [Choiromyces venosus 120613-1]
MPGMDQQIEFLGDGIADLPGQCFFGIPGKSFESFGMEDSVDLPFMNMLLLTWDTMLVVFGKPDRHLAKGKTCACGLVDLYPEVGDGLITPSPLDYHVFRQDIKTKYPAYDPPNLLFPFEVAVNSFPMSFAINNATG